MIQIMLYHVIITTLLGLAAFAAEPLLANFGAARRGTWIAALSLSIALPLLMVVEGQRSASYESTAGGTETASGEIGVTPQPGFESIEVLSTNLGGGTASIAVDSGRMDFIESWYETSNWSALDNLLAAIWITSSLLFLLTYTIAHVGLHRAARRWSIARIDGSDVLTSGRIGPAVFGLVKTRIVIPAWLLDKPVEMQELVLRHEREHAGKRDHLLLAGALALIALAPWNVALWWQLRRLRLAIEIDCDARVVRNGVDAVDYSRMLLAIRHGRASAPFASVALTAPVSLLERRIRALIPARPPRRTLGIGGTVLAGALVGAACTMTPPSIELESDTGTISPLTFQERQPVTHLRLDGQRTLLLVDASSSMLDRSLNQVLARNNMSDAAKLSAPKWRQVVNTVDWLTARIPLGADFQVMAFNSEAWSLIEGTDGQWLTANDRSQLDEAVANLGNTIPTGGTSLHAAFQATNSLEPRPDNVYLLVDGLPTMGETLPTGPAVTARERLSFFESAERDVPRGVRFNVILYPFEGDPWSTPAYWRLALNTDGSLLAPAEDTSSEAILGVPLDSEYIIFIIDTSPSMRQNEWDRVQQQVRETLDSYPVVSGVQVLNDEGEHLFLASRNNWMQDSPALRQAIFESLEDWDAYSNSNPRQGIVDAIRNYSDPQKNISIYVFSDDFSEGGGLIDSVVREVEAQNRNNLNDAPLVRIHSVAFPVFFDRTGQMYTGADYAILMRNLSQRNGGTFVALPSRSAN